MDWQRQRHPGPTYFVQPEPAWLRSGLPPVLHFVPRERAYGWQPPRRVLQAQHWPEIALRLRRRLRESRLWHVWTSRPAAQSLHRSQVSRALRRGGRRRPSQIGPKRQEQESLSHGAAWDGLPVDLALTIAPQNDLKKLFQALGYRDFLMTALSCVAAVRQKQALVAGGGRASPSACRVLKGGSGLGPSTAKVSKKTGNDVAGSVQKCTSMLAAVEPAGRFMF